MKRTKAQLEAQLKVAQTLVTDRGEVIERQREKIRLLEQGQRSATVEVHQQVYELTNRVADLQRRLLRRAGKVDALQDLVLVAMGKHRGSLRVE